MGGAKWYFRWEGEEKAGFFLAKYFCHSVFDCISVIHAISLVSAANLSSTGAVVVTLGLRLKGQEHLLAQ